MQICIEHSPKNDVLPVVATLPHSGTYVPVEIDGLFDDEHRSWLRNTDWYLPEVYSFLPSAGVTMLEATHSRYVTDVNRDPSGELFGAFSRALIAKENQGRAVYMNTPDENALRRRISAYHMPYHAALRGLVTSHLERFGRVLLLDLHRFMGPTEHEICIGDGFGVTCSPQSIDTLQNAFAERGFDVSRNKPYSGGYTIRHYGRPPTVEALMIELRYTTYLDCTRVDEPGRPRLDRLRIEALQARIRPAMTDAIKSIVGRAG